MHPAKTCLQWSLLILLAATGCWSKSNSGQNGPIKKDVKDLVGNWLVVVSNKNSEDYRWLLKFTRGSDSKLSAEFIDTSRDMDKDNTPEIIATEVVDNDIRLEIKNARSTFDFVGKFEEGYIRGTVRASAVELFMARMLPTDEKSLQHFNPSGKLPGADIFESLMKSKDLKPETIYAAAKEFRYSPLSQEIYMMIMTSASQTMTDEVKMKEVIDEFLAAARFWGERWEARMEMDIAVILINGRQFARMAPEHLEAAQKKMGVDRDYFQEANKAYLEMANILIASQDVLNPATAEAVRAAGYATLAESLKKQRFNSDILIALATESERLGKVDEAIDYFSRIVALPLVELTVLRSRAGSPPDTPKPSESLEKLWKQKFGNLDGYASHLDQVYHEKIAEFLSELQKNGSELPAADAGNKTVLVELFTGMQCPPCIPADLALRALGQTIPSSKLVVVEYHQHIPGPDGLVNQDAEERAAFYEVAATPTVVVDGRVIDPRFYAGPIQAAANGYRVFRQVVEPGLSQKTDVELKVSAQITNGELTVTAEAVGIPEDLLPSCRLRLAIVENEVHTIAPLYSNGIRDHENVVRELLSGAKGITPKDGELKYTLTTPIADVQRHVTDYISRYEAGRRMEFPPEMKPPMQGPLSVVAWVQNGKVDKDTQAKLVLQSTIVPVKDDTAAPKETKTETEAAASSPAEPEKTAAVAAPTAQSAPAADHSAPAPSFPPAPALPEE